MMLNRKHFVPLLADLPSWKIGNKGCEALHNIVLDIDDQLLCSNVQTQAGQMYDELWWSFEMFQRNINNLTLNVNRKEFMHSQQMTLHDMFKQ